MKIDCVIGIDPGKTGGIAVWKPNGFLKVVKMPDDLTDLSLFINQYKECCNPIIFLEKLQLRHSDLSIPGKAFRIQKLLNNFEQLKTVVHLLDIPYVLVNPMKWQDELNLRIKGTKRVEETKDRKNRYKLIAQKHYPEFKQALWSADATMIMHFGRFALVNRQRWILENLPQKMHNKLF